jgi:hypothetical protein
MQIYKSGRPIECRYSNGVFTRLPPEKPGEYRLLDENRKILYIGQTSNLKRRMHEHMHSGKIGSGSGMAVIFAYKVADGRVSHSSLTEHETAKIRKHQPIMNQRGGGGGRPFNRKNKKYG